MLEFIYLHAKLPVKGYVNKGLRNDRRLKRYQGYEDKRIALISKIIRALFGPAVNKLIWEQKKAGIRGLY